MTGQRAVELSVAEPADLQRLSEAMAEQVPELKSLLPISRWAVNHQFMPLSTPLAPGQEIALIPPVSGG